jgi:hypothetical protein
VTRVDGETFDLLAKDGAQVARFTLNRDAATSEESLELLGLDHPILLEQLGRWRTLPPEELGISVKGEVDAPVALTLWHVEASNSKGERRTFIQPIAVKQDGTRIPTVEKLAASFLQKNPAPESLSLDQRVHLIKHVVEPMLERELKHKGAAAGEGSYSAELLVYAEISPG